MYRTVNTTPTEHHLVCRVDNGINRQCRNIAFDNFDHELLFL
jgi:hypothetical protein